MISLSKPDNAPTLSRGDLATLVEWYEKDPNTGASGHTLHSGWIAGDPEHVRKHVMLSPLFDSLVHCYSANPNGGERVLAVIPEDGEAIGHALSLLDEIIGYAESIGDANVLERDEITWAARAVGGWLRGLSSAPHDGG